MSFTLTISALVLVTGITTNYMPMARFVPITQTIQFTTLKECVDVKESFRFNHGLLNTVVGSVGDCTKDETR